MFKAGVGSSWEDITHATYTVTPDLYSILIFYEAD